MTVFYKCGNQRKPVGEVSKVQSKRWTSENMKGVGQCMRSFAWHSLVYVRLLHSKRFPACLPGYSNQWSGLDQIADERTFVSI